MTVCPQQTEAVGARLTGSGLFASRYFRTDDPTVDAIRISAGALRRRKRVWRLSKMRWWSRHYEYRWLTDCLEEYFGSDRSDKSVLDAACGNDHPGCLMLAKMRFGRVDALDMYERHPVIEQFAFENLTYIKGNLAQPLGRTYDAVCCISLLEHLRRPLQETVMANLCDAVADGGCLVVTFVTPGFEHDTDPALYADVLSRKGIHVHRVDVPEPVQMTSRNSRTPYPGWPLIGRDVTSVYRLFGMKA